MYFQKAFVKVPHRCLLSKIRSYELDDEIHDWITAFLTKRTHRVKVNGNLSSPAAVTSGIPQGSVLGPVLFVLYINDLPTTLTNKMFMFADNTKVYNSISDVKSAQSLQHDLDRLLQWSTTWLLPFHPEKCKIMQLGKEKDEFKYRLGDVELETSTCEKDLGVHVDDNLSFSKHIDVKITKANAIMGVVRRSFRHLDSQIFPKIFKSMIRPHLEYAAPVWSPYLKNEITKLEQVQRRATKQIPDLKDMSYKERLIKLRLPTLAYRRMRGDLIEVYKLLSNKYDTQVFDLLSLHRDMNPNSTTRGHSLKLCKKRFHHKFSQYTFTRRVVDLWNQLPEQVVNATSLISFEKLLDKHCDILIIKYDFDTAMQQPNPFRATGGRSHDLPPVPCGRG